MTSNLRVSLIQAATLWHDAVGNRALYASLARPLAGTTDLVVLPETFTSGFTNDTLANAESMDGESLTWMRALARDVGAVITGSIVIRSGERNYNRLIWMRPDGSYELYDKRHLFRMAGEQERYAGGNDKLLVELHGWRVCPMVCYDLRFPVWIRNRFGASVPERFDYDLFVVVANWPAPRRTAWRTLLRARAIENLAYAVGVNRVGTDGNRLDYAGDSAAVDFLGETVVELGSQAQVLTVTLDAAALAAHRERFPAQLDADAFAIGAVGSARAVPLGATT